MGCLIALVALISPRLALFGIWLFSDRFDVAFDSNLLPLAGFFLLPWTTLVFTLAYAPGQGVTDVGWVFVILAVLADIGALGSGESARRDRA